MARNKQKPKIRFWKGASGRWYIHIIANNNKLVWDGGQGYSSKAAAKRAAKRNQQIAAEAEIVDDPLTDEEISEMFIKGAESKEK